MYDIEVKNTPNYPKQGFIYKSSEEGEMKGGGSNKTANSSSSGGERITKLWRRK